MKINYWLVLFLSITNFIYSQGLLREEVSKELIDFLYVRKEITYERVKDYKDKKYTFFLSGVINRDDSRELKEGLYTFSSLISHSRTYFILVDKNKYEIFELDSREKLDMTLVRILDFCEEKRICVDIKTEYIERLVNVYYNVNRFVDNELDIDCYDYDMQKANLP